MDRLGLASAQAPIGAVGATTTVGRVVVGAADGLSVTRARAVGEGTVARGSSIAAWLPIIYGCDKTCTYCIVPFSRGPERSRPFDDIVDEARSLAAAGYREVTLLGQNVNSYGHDLAPDPRFAHVSESRWAGRRLDLQGRPDLAELDSRDRRASDGRRPAGDRAPSVRDLAPVGPVRSADRGACRVRQRLRAPSSARSSRATTRSSAGWVGSTRSSTTSSGSTGSARRCRASRSRPTSSSASAARQSPRSSRRCACSRPSGTTRSSPRPTRRDPGTPATKMADDVPADVKRRRLNELLALQEGIGLERNTAVARARGRGPCRWCFSAAEHMTTMTRTGGGTSASDADGTDPRATSSSMCRVPRRSSAAR